jgi:hypothetical protein
MGSILSKLLPLFIGPISGLVTTRVMDLIDDGLKLTASWSDSVKQLLVMALAAVIPLLNASWGINLPTDPSALATPTTVQYVVGLVIALILKGHASASAAASGSVTAQKPPTTAVR